MLNLTGRIQGTFVNGWSFESQGRCSVSDSTASIRLYNPGPLPVSLTLRLAITNSSYVGTLRLRLNALPLRDVSLGFQNSPGIVSVSNVPLSRGGHTLFFEQFPRVPDLSFDTLEIEACDYTPEELVIRLPFDIYQRYKLAADLASLANPSSILDIGGVIGDQDGHLGTPHDFFYASGVALETKIIASDIRPCDHPDHVQSLAWRQPFPDESFDVVVSMDVLEHIEGPCRKAFLRECFRVARKAVILGAPFHSPATESVEDLLLQTTFKGHSFLTEHRRLGLPDESIIKDVFCKSRDLSLYEFPNANLYTWAFLQVLTNHYFQTKEYAAILGFNRLVNSSIDLLDNCTPTYRKVFVVARREGNSDDSFSRRLGNFHKKLPRKCIRDFSGTAGLLAANNKELAEVNVRWKGIFEDFARLHGVIRTSRSREETLRSNLAFLLNEERVKLRQLYGSLAEAYERLTLTEDRVKALESETLKEMLTRWWRRRGPLRSEQLIERRETDV